MRHRRRKLWIALAVLLVISAIVVAVLLRKRAAPDTVRLLPNADAILYVNLEPIRLLTDLGKHPPKNPDPEYEDFVRQTGFEFERDLSRAALAIHYAHTPANPGAETRYSEILQGQFDSQRVTDYLRKLSKNVERYNDFDIYIIPLEGRTVRVVLLGIGMAAASNTEGPDAIHGMVDRYKQAALPFAGPDLVRDYYARVPLGSVLWTIARIPLNSAPQDRSELLLPGSWSSLLPRGSTVIASARPLNDVRLRAQVITSSENEARNFSDRVNAFLAIFKSINISMDGGGPDPDVKRAFDSFEVHQDKNEAVLTASVPFAFFKKIVSEAPVEFGSDTTKPPDQAAPAAGKHPPEN
ncbi:MAG TPA: hypothetical protein VMU45_06790 [Candidatus Eisenbacteria bacterium]|nr:hypothetical protein [Candidatus Eisenbacteria bacterium]